MKLVTHMPDGERRKRIDIEVCRTKVKVTTSKNRTKIRQNKYLIFALFVEDVTLTFVLQTSISIGFLLSPSGMCVPSFMNEMLNLNETCYTYA
jgi:hypothetical protein